MPLKSVSAFIRFLQIHKYEVLLLALVQHLFIGIFLTDMPHYTRSVWWINMLVLGVASIGVFAERGRWRNLVRDLLCIPVIGLPLTISAWWHIPEFMMATNITYCLFFAFIFVEVFRFLLRPSYINVDIISAAACGYFLLIEISVFGLQLYFYDDPNSFKGVSNSDPASTFIDLVYFCSITLTSIGFGDITPNNHHTKLIAAFIGIAGQFYSVILVGIVISKFAAQQE
ncbi:MAG: ion channel [Saprospiraceae bacterium]